MTLLRSIIAFLIGFSMFQVWVYDNFWTALSVTLISAYTVVFKVNIPSE